MKIRRNDSLKNEKEQIGHTQLRKTDIDVIKGARQTDQLERLKSNTFTNKFGWHRHSKLASILVLSVMAMAGLVVLANVKKLY